VQVRTPAQGRKDTRDGIAGLNDESEEKGFHGRLLLSRMRCGAVPRVVEAQVVLRKGLISISCGDCKPPQAGTVQLVNSIRVNTANTIRCRSPCVIDVRRPR
jgi:hypothetical protein